MKRGIMSVSLSAANPDAQIVLAALKGVAKNQRSAELLRWAAAYLSGQTNTQPALLPELGMTEDELDALFDDF